VETSSNRRIISPRPIWLTVGSLLWRFVASSVTFRVRYRPRRRRLCNDGGLFSAVAFVDCSLDVVYVSGAVRLVGLELFGGLVLELELSPVVLIRLIDTAVHGVDHGGEAI
jgi:hypothetical protein